MSDTHTALLKLIKIEDLGATAQGSAVNAEVPALPHLVERKLQCYSNCTASKC